MTIQTCLHVCNRTWRQHNHLKLVNLIRPGQAYINMLLKPTKLNRHHPIPIQNEEGNHTPKCQEVEEACYPSHYISLVLHLSTIAADTDKNNYHFHQNAI